MASKTEKSRNKTETDASFLVSLFDFLRRLLHQGSRSSIPSCRGAGVRYGRSESSLLFRAWSLLAPLVPSRLPTDLSLSLPFFPSQVNTGLISQACIPFGGVSRRFPMPSSSSAPVFLADSLSGLARHRSRRVVSDEKDRRTGSRNICRTNSSLFPFSSVI